MLHQADVTGTIGLYVASTFSMQQPSLTTVLQEIFTLKNWTSAPRLFMTGFTMGAADIVPGVSGGTVAFLLGIYEELIYSIKLVSGEVLKLLLQRKFAAALQLIPFHFLVPLGLGLLTALLSMAKLITFLLATYPIFVWSFFFGLVIASCWIVQKRIVTWDLHDYAALAMTTIFTYFLVGMVPVETPNNYLTLFVSGAIAICAMILPGISGSFLLVIMGKYEQILSAVTNRDIVPLLVFTAGTVVGLSIFSRVLSWLFAKHHDFVIALLIGFMLGSLRKVWPWKEVITTRVNSHGDIVPLLEKNILPAQFDSTVVLCLGLAAFGFAVILLLDKLQVTKEQTSDLHNEKFVKQHKKAVLNQKKHTI
jgi:putative membrane protein